MATTAYKLETELSAQHQGKLISPSMNLPLNVSRLLPGDEDEVLTALSAPSLTNVIMSGFVRDNGLASSLNRGHFYACRNEENKLEGVALIGHTILFEAFSEN